MPVEKLYLKRNDLQPYYLFQVKDSLDAVVDITGATIRCTMVLYDPATGLLSTIKINRQTAGINLTDAANGKGEYQWQSGDTDTIGTYRIEFEVTPASGGKFTVPNPRYGQGIVIINADLDST